MTAVPLTIPLEIERDVDEYPSISLFKKTFEFFPSTDFTLKGTVPSIDAETYNETSSTLSFERVSTGRARLETQYREAVEELNQYAEFTVGWNGYDGKPFSREVIELAHTILSAIYAQASHLEEPFSELTPGPAEDGSLDIEIAFNRKYCRFTIYQDKLFFYSRENRKSEEFSFDSVYLGKKLDWLFS